MRQSQLFTKTAKHAPKDEVSNNAKLLIRAGFINKEMAGVYSLLPLGLRVVKKIENIIREEMDALGGQEINLSALQDSSTWKKTDRWDDKKVDAWFKTKLKNKTEIGLGFTHEEPLTRLLTNHINSYKDLPKFIYQFQDKFRNEVRAKSGILRAREFLMKDLYSFHTDEKDLDSFYDLAAKSYKNIFNKVGIGDKTYRTYASGGMFSKYSHEFQTLTDAGEDIIYICQKCNLAVNKEIKKETPACPDCKSKKFKEEKAVEVGNIFKLGTKFSDTLGLLFKDKEGNKKPVIMGSYGIGLGRLMGTAVEVNHDSSGIIWPNSIAPFKAHLIVLGDEKEIQLAEKVYKDLSLAGIEVLFDDRNSSAGEKLATSDLIGIPYRLVISPKTKSKIELKSRNEDGTTLLDIKAISKKLKS